MRAVFLLALLALPLGAQPRKQMRAATPDAHAPAPRPDASTVLKQAAPQPPPPPPAISPHRFGKFDLDTPFAQVRALPELRDCLLTAPSGRADCTLRDAEPFRRAQLAWEDGRNGPELIALRLVYDPQLAPALTDLEWQLTRGWGAPSLEQLRRDRETKFFTLQWEDADHRATLEAQGSLLQPSRAVALSLERKQAPPGGEFVGLHPRPFAGFRMRWLRRIDWEGQVHALVWGTSLTPAQQAMGESSAAWAAQRDYVGLWKLEPATAQRPRRWKPLWERSTGGDDDDEPERILSVDARDVTGDATPDVEVELACETCGATASELLIKTVRAGKLVDLLTKHDLYRARVEYTPGQVSIREPEGENDEGSTLSVYSYDRGKGAFVLSREERLPSR